MDISLKHHSKALRQNQTKAEEVVWRHLRNRRLGGYKFRRQVILGSYIIDFLCLEPKLIIELDGGQHAEQQTYDKKRTLYLNKLGYKVIRFWNHDVLNKTEDILENILLAVQNLK